jgi:DNA-binding MarR family transcriptional regulator
MMPPRARDDRDTETADRLHSAAIHLLRRLRREDDASGLAAPKLSALSVIVHAGPITFGALAAAEQVRPPTMTRIVAALEADGLVKREADALDGRVAHVRATARGARVLEQGRARRVAALSKALRELTPAERATLDQAVAIMERLSGSGRHRG